MTTQVNHGPTDGESDLVAKPTDATGTESAILVTVRVRPFNDKEKAHMAPPTPNRFTIGNNITTNTPTTTWGNNKPMRKVVHVVDDRILVFDPPEEDNSPFGRTATPAQANKRHKDVRFAFDRVFNEDASQQEVYAGTTQDLIDAVLNGFNATVFAYGATGCGKTHTISGTPTDPGIIFLTMKELFEKIRSYESEKIIEASLSYLEVYNETIRDLLVPEGTSAPSLALREDLKHGVVVAGLSEHTPTTVEDVMELVLLGNKNRTQSPTEANATSSRSHAVLQIRIRQKSRAAGLSSDVVCATLSLIDLAGSERASVSKNRGDRLLEGANINRSLLALANCINALCDEKKKRHIPYRDSKLTRLLKFSLGGNCRTVMIVCCSPASTYYEETHNTLKYANRAKNIKTRVERNTVSVKAHVSQYVKRIKEQSELIQRLQAENATLRNKVGSTAPGASGVVTVKQSDLRLPTAALQRMEDIRNALATAYDAVRSTEWEYASVSVVADIFTQYRESLEQWRTSMNNSGLLDTSMDESTLGNHGAQQVSVLRLLEELENHAGVLHRQLDATSALLTRYRAKAQRSDYTSNIALAKTLTSDQKCRLDLEKRAFELNCTNTRLSRSLELSQTMLFGCHQLLRRFMQEGAQCLVRLDQSVQTLESGTADVMGTADYLRRMHQALTTLLQDTVDTISESVHHATAAGPAKWQVPPLSPSKLSSQLTANLLVPHPPTIRTSSRATPSRSASNENRRTVRQLLNGSSRSAASANTLGSSTPTSVASNGSSTRRSRASVSSTTSTTSGGRSTTVRTSTGGGPSASERRAALRAARHNGLPPLPNGTDNKEGALGSSTHKRTRGMLSSQPSLETLKPNKRLAGGTGTTSVQQDYIPRSPYANTSGGLLRVEVPHSPEQSDTSFISAASFTEGDLTTNHENTEPSPRYQPPPLDAVPSRSILKSAVARNKPSYAQPTAASRSHSLTTSHSGNTRNSAGGPMRNTSTRRRSRHTFQPMGPGIPGQTAGGSASAAQGMSGERATGGGTRHRISARRLLEAAKSAKSGTEVPESGGRGRTTTNTSTTTASGSSIIGFRSLS
ncbi:tubulin-dependent ATPase kip3 [Dispira simplex]|nr:tubulin-dependent ATPase kip3 [Dispira simplex]